MVVFPNCKINLGLHITSKRDDGFHNIESVMMPVGWSDVFEVVAHDSGIEPKHGLTGQAHSDKVHFYSYGHQIPGSPEDNLCIKVYHLLEEWYNLTEVDMHLVKNVPIGAGLGGGSADAAFCLRALKDFFSLSISDLEAKSLLSKLGSDCPFFWDNSPAFVYGKGDEMRGVEINLKGKWVLLVYPNIAISTPRAYSGVTPTEPKIDLEMLPDLPLETWKEVIVNDFERSVFPQFPTLSNIKAQLYDCGAVYASLSGSGSTLYGIFYEEPNAIPDFNAFATWVGQW